MYNPSTFSRVVAMVSVTMVVAIDVLMSLEGGWMKMLRCLCAQAMDIMTTAMRLPSTKQPPCVSARIHKQLKMSIKIKRRVLLCLQDVPFLQHQQQKQKKKWNSRPTGWLFAFRSVNWHTYTEILGDCKQGVRVINYKVNEGTSHSKQRWSKHV